MKTLIADFAGDADDADRKAGTLQNENSHELSS
jgi:hypothetical protein